MQLKDQKIPYSLSLMEEYCKENIDKYDVEPIVREAFHAGLINVKSAFIYLRIAQMEVQEEKITGNQIASEAGVRPSLITKYKKNRMVGITQKRFIQLLLMTHNKDMLDLWERSDFNQALADYVNTYRGMIIKNDVSNDLQNGFYELEHDGEISKDVCRKIYGELVDKRVKSLKFFDEERDCIISVNIVSSKEITKVIISCEIGNDTRYIKFECENDKLVHKIVGRIQNLIGGLRKSDVKERKVYLERSEKRKVQLAMEYLALSDEAVYLL